MNSRYEIVGVVNVTPDSFSDGGRFYDTGKAVEHGLQLIEEGADILDIGGESTRPGAASVSPDKEIERICPVIEALAGKGALISIDTRHAATMEAAIEAGAEMINDVTALTGDEASLSAAAKSNAQICLMHMQGRPQTMQDNPVYSDVVEDVYAYLHERIKACELAGIEKSRLIIDPGIGFGKTPEHNMALIKNIARFNDLNVAVMLGVSRKSFIPKICGMDISADRRLPGSLAPVLYAFSQGAMYFRVHDVAETRQALGIYQAITSA